MTLHYLSSGTDSPHYGWSLCPQAAKRGGPVQMRRLTDDPEQVTCLHCLDRLTRP